MTLTTRVVDIDPRTDPRWGAFVQSHPEGLVYHHPLWIEVLQRTYGHEPACLACEDQDGTLQGVLPLFRSRGLFLGQRWSSLPHSPVGGPLVRNQRAVMALLRAAMARIDRTPGSSLQIKLPPGTRHAAADGLVTVAGEMTFVLDLPDRLEALRFGSSRNHSRLAWSVRKAAKQHIEVRPAESETDLHAWYPLYLDTMRRHAVPPRPFQLFRAMWDLLRPAGIMRFLLAEQRLTGRTRLIAGSMLLMSGRTVFYAFNGWRREERPEHANDAIQWHAIRDACREGYAHYDFGEVDPHNRGLADFKTKWGAAATRLYRWYYPQPQRFDALIRGASSAGGRLVPAAWRWLPLKVTALLGDRLYRRL